MQTITLRRTFNIGNYESLTIEAIGEDDDLNKARLKANKTILELTQQELIRIFNIRTQNINNNPFEQVALELNGINIELKQGEHQ